MPGSVLSAGTQRWVSYNGHKTFTFARFVPVVPPMTLRHNVVSKDKRKPLKLWLKLINISCFCIRNVSRHFKSRVNTLKGDDSDFSW